MSDATPPPMPDYLPPSPPQRKPRTNLIIIGSAAAVIAAIVGTGVFVVNSRDGNADTAATASGTPTGDALAVTADEESEPERTYAELNADSFEIKLRTTDRQCFGSAGCNVTVEPGLTYVGLDDIDPDAVYEITYEIRGDKSGPVIATAELSDETSLNYTPTLIQTVSSGTKVSVEITDVVSRGY